MAEPFLGWPSSFTSCCSGWRYIGLARAMQQESVVGQGRAGLGVSFLCFLLELQINKIRRHPFYSIKTLFETY